MKTYIQPQIQLYKMHAESMLAASNDRTISADTTQDITEIYSESKDSWSSESWDEE